MGMREDPNANTVGKSSVEPSKSAIKYENFCSILEDPELAGCFMTLPYQECFLNLPNDSATESPLDIQTISENQKKDSKLTAWANKRKDLHFEKDIDGHPILCFC